ncbi:hypothetical protein ES708_23348 [subsurface metagenome]
MPVEIIKALTVPFAILVVGLLVWAALSQGIDGAVFMTGLAIVGGLGGYEIKALVAKLKKNGTPPKQ